MTQPQGFVAVDLTPEEGRIWERHLYGLNIGYVTTSYTDRRCGNWYRVITTTDCPDKFPSVVAVDPLLVKTAMSVWYASLKKDAKKKGWTNAEKLTASLPTTLTTLWEKLINLHNGANTMIDLTNITAEKLAELKKQIADREAVLKKVTETQHSFEVAAKKAGYETLDAALADLGYVKASAKPTKTRKASSGERKPRVKMTDELRNKVIASIQAGGKTDKEIAEENNLSSGTVAKIKKEAKEAGLVKK